ncbi:MAG: TonB-dependent receptor [Gemmatimonadales bacterium]
MRGNIPARVVLAVLAAWGALGSPASLAAQQPEGRARNQQVDSAEVVRADSTAAADTAAAITPDYILEPIEVVAARERSVAPPVATITIEPRELQQTLSENPYDLIRRVAGLEVHDQGQGPGFASNVVLRGFTADHSSDVLIVVDGVPLNLPVHGHVEGYADWNYLFPGAISSMRVIHGPSSPLYGDFSIAGTVEVYTKADGNGLAGQLTGNGFGDASGWASLGTSGERGGALAGVELKRFTGWRDNSGQRSGNGLVRGWRQVGEGRLEGGLSFYKADWHSPGFLSLADFASGDREAAANPTDGGDQWRGMANARYALPLGGERFLQLIGWGVVSDWDLALTVPGHTDAVGNLYQTAEADQRRALGGQVELSWLPSAGELTIGVAGRHDRSEYDLGRSLRRVSIEPMVALDAGHTSASAYARWRWHPFARLGLDLGARVDHLRNRSYNRLGLADPSPSVVTAQLAAVGEPRIRAEDIRPDFHIIGDGGPVGVWVSGDMTLVSPKVGAELRMSDRWSLMASSSRGFRSAVGVVGDPNREPVVAWSHELGVEYATPQLTAHLSGFRMDVSHERIQDPITLEIASSGSSVRQGVEATLELGLVGEARLFARGTLTDAVLSGRYADAHDDHNQPGTGTGTGVESPKQDVPGIARYLAQVALETPLFGELSGRTEWRVTGPYVPIGEPEVETDPYSTLDASLSYPIREGMRVDLEVRNVLDRVYPETRSSGYVSPGTPRSIGIALQVIGR